MLYILSCLLTVVVRMSQDAEAEHTKVPELAMSVIADFTSAIGSTEFVTPKLLTNSTWGKLARDCMETLLDLSIFASALLSELYNVRYQPLDVKIFIITWEFENNIATSLSVTSLQIYRDQYCPYMICSQLGRFLREAIEKANTIWNLQLKLTSIIDQFEDFSLFGTNQYIKLFYPEIIDKFSENYTIDPSIMKLRPPTTYMYSGLIPIPTTTVESSKGIISLFKMLCHQLHVTTMAVSAYRKLIDEITDIYARFEPIWSASDHILLQSFLPDASDFEIYMIRLRNLKQHFPAAKFTSTIDLVNKFIKYEDELKFTLNYIAELKKMFEVNDN